MINPSPSKSDGCSRFGVLTEEGQEISRNREDIRIGDLRVEHAAPSGTPKGHPMLFVHGTWEGSWFWEYYLQFFSGRGYDCYALNLRGHDGSTPGPTVGKQSVRDYLDDVSSVIDALGNPILIGHSMGGLLVQKLAEMIDPPGIVALTPGAPRGILRRPSYASIRIFLKHVPGILLFPPLMPSFDDMKTLLLNRLPEREQKRIYAMQTPESGRRAFEIAVLRLPVDASGVRSPMLVVGGEDDNIVAVRTIREIARKYNAEMYLYPGFAHYDRAGAGLAAGRARHSRVARSSGRVEFALQGGKARYHNPPSVRVWHMVPVATLVVDLSSGLVVGQ